MTVTSDEVARALEEALKEGDAEDPVIKELTDKLTIGDARPLARIIRRVLKKLDVPVADDA